MMKLNRYHLLLAAATCLTATLNAAFTLDSTSHLLLEVDMFASDDNINVVDTAGDVKILTFTNPSKLSTNNVFLDYWSGGDTLDFTHTTVEAGTYDFSILYNIGLYSPSRDIELLIDADEPGNFVSVARWTMKKDDFVVTGDWNAGPAAASTVKRAQLPAGTYTLRYATTEGNKFGIQVDAFTITSILDPGAYTSIPEPSSFILLIGLSALGVVTLRRSRRR